MRSGGADGILDAIQRFSTATLNDAGRRLGYDGAVRGIGPTSGPGRLAGRAVTARLGSKREASGSAINFYDVLAEAAAGGVLVIELGDDRWVAGANMTTFAMQRNLAGFLVDGCMRDLGEIRSLDFSTFSRGAAVSGYNIDYSLVEANSTITCGGIRVSPGDIVIGDEDGAFIVPERMAGELLYQAEDIDILDRRQAELIKACAPVADLKANVQGWGRRRSRAP
jgi:regulator of RNase E activity RraA